MSPAPTRTGSPPVSVPAIFFSVPVGPPATQPAANTEKARSQRTRELPPSSGFSTWRETQRRHAAPYATSDCPAGPPALSDRRALRPRGVRPRRSRIRHDSPPRTPDPGDGPGDPVRLHADLPPAPLRPEKRRDLGSLALPAAALRRPAPAGGRRRAGRHQ